MGKKNDRFLVNLLPDFHPASQELGFSKVELEKASRLQVKGCKTEAIP
jgi:hypothetical protein